jgi:DNA-binding response OmpR family regulator
MPGGQVGVILYVEDDGVVRLSLASALEEAGFVVREVDDGRQALAVLEAEGSEVRGLITDVNLGSEPDGWEIARSARERDAALPVVYVSGESQETWAAKGVPNSVMIAKPFVPTQVVVALSMLLNTTSSGSAT